MLLKNYEKGELETTEKNIFRHSQFNEIPLKNLGLCNIFLKILFLMNETIKNWVKNILGIFFTQKHTI